MAVSMRREESCRVRNNYCYFFRKMKETYKCYDADWKDSIREEIKEDIGRKLFFCGGS